MSKADIAKIQERKRDPKLLNLMGGAIAARKLLLASGTPRNCARMESSAEAETL
ncbi:hypothetical protein [Sphingomonas sp. YL-JM2C]